MNRNNKKIIGESFVRIQLLKKSTLLASTIILYTAYILINHALLNKQALSGEGQYWYLYTSTMVSMPRCHSYELLQGPSNIVSDVNVNYRI
jgi:hypothetical protein